MEKQTFPTAKEEQRGDLLEHTPASLLKVIQYLEMQAFLEGNQDVIIGLRFTQLLIQQVKRNQNDKTSLEKAFAILKAELFPTDTIL